MSACDIFFATNIQIISSLSEIYMLQACVIRSQLYKTFHLSHAFLAYFMLLQNINI